MLLVALLLLEKVFVLHLPPTWLHRWVQWFVAMPLTFGLSLLLFGRRRLRLPKQEVFPIGYGSAGVHLAGLLVLAALEIGLAHLGGERARGTPAFRAIAMVWTALLPVLVISLATTLVPWRVLVRVARGLGMAWVFAALCTTILVVLRQVAYASWDSAGWDSTSWDSAARHGAGGSPALQGAALGVATRLVRTLQTASFSEARWVLQRFYPVVLSDPARHLLGTPRFLVRVSWLCSGIEGLALILVLSVAWLVLSRRELRIGRALLVVPFALGLTWVGNVVRLSVLIAIGDAGYERIADKGFHAQAGWIASNIVSLGCLFLVQRIAWFHRWPAEVEDAAERARVEAVPVGVPRVNYAAVYLLPFAAIVAASLVTQALSGGFEWLYPLRFVVGVAALWAGRRELRRIDWRFGWMGPLAGLLVAVMWLGLHAAMRPSGAGAVVTALGLMRLPAGARFGWVTVRVLAAVTTVPIAEELAFRGFVARRVMRAEFEEVRYRDLSVVALVASSLAFGAMHGHMWVAGAVAGMAFGVVAKLRGRIGEAVAAHLTANLLIAVVVLLRGDYSLW